MSNLPAGILPGPFGVCRFGDCLPLIECRKKQRLPKEPRSIIVALFPWYAGEFFSRNVALYAVGDDYHRLVGGFLDRACQSLRELFPGAAFAPFVDSSPIREVEAAHLAGLGAIGRNGLLLHEAFGSRVFIGEIVTDLELSPSPSPQTDCAGCNRCVEACPTGALGGKLDKSLCRSAITQKKAPLSAWEESEIRQGGLVWGCELCQSCCPYNENPVTTPIEEFRENPVPVVTADNLSAILPQKTYSYRGEGVLRRNLLLLNNR